MSLKRTRELACRKLCLSVVAVLMNSLLCNLRNCVWHSCVKQAESLRDEDSRSEQLRDVVMVPATVDLQVSI
jgi:hypothetical protein